MGKNSSDEMAFFRNRLVYNLLLVVILMYGTSYTPCTGAQRLSEMFDILNDG